MRSPLLSIVLLLALCLLGGCMPGTAPGASNKQLAHNEERLREQGIVALEPGNPAPSFSAVGTAGSSLKIGPVAPVGTPADPVQGSAQSSSSGSTGQTVLLFFPAANAPNSAKQLLEFDKAAAKLEEQQLQVYGINTAPLAELEDFARRYEIKTPLLSDSDGSISVSYGCLVEGGRFPQRTVVVIGADGRVALFHRGHVTPQLLLSELKLDAKATADPASES